MNIAVIGGGASGMCAAIAAADNGAGVTIFEHMPRMGRKLLLTGSGKCNISNTDMDLSHFHGEPKDRIRAVLEKCGQDKTLEFLGKLGLLTRERKGYLYPYCEQASAVVDILRFSIRDRGIDVHTDADIRRIEKPVRSNDRNTEDRFIIVTANGRHTFDRVILCCGSSANRNTGSDGSGYAFARDFGHTVIKPLPALTYLVCEEDFYPSLAGIRTKANITLYVRDEEKKWNAVGSEEGELQLTKTGISGVAVFNLSYLAVRSIDMNRHVKAVLDLLPDIDPKDIKEFMKCRIANMTDRSLEELFIGILAKPLGILIMKRCGLDLKRKCSDLYEHEIGALCKTVKSFDTFIKGSGDLNASQVAQGGVSLAEVTDTLESGLVSGLYFAGEILDVNGDCGGYNLQWAVSSGIIAGREASK